jgi:hypothetical protein
VTLTPGSGYGDDGSPRRDARTDPRTNPQVDGQRRRRVPARFALLGALVIVVLVATSTGSIRSWWAHRVHDLTGGSRPADFAIGLFVALLPLIGVLIGMLRTRGARRVFRMFAFGAFGFIVTYLLAPSPARYLSDHSSARVFDTSAPSYLAGVFTGTMLWLVALLVGLLRARARWRRFRNRHLGPGRDGRNNGAQPPRVIDI